MSCNTLEKVESKNPSLFKVLIQNVEHCILPGQLNNPKIQWFLNVVYIKISTPEKPKQQHPQPDPTDPNLNPPSVDPAIGNLLKKLSSQPLESLQQLFLGLQLEVSKRELHPNPNPNNSNGNPPLNSPNGSGNPLKLNETVNKLGVTIVKVNENVIETIASHGLLRSQTPKISQFSDDGLKGDVSFEPWEYEVGTLSGVYTESAI